MKFLSVISMHVIRLYQRTISPDHGWFRHRHPHGFCRFYPTCSEYARKAILRYGFFRGMAKSSWRVLRCNPWNAGGFDPVT